MARSQPKKFKHLPRSRNKNSQPAPHQRAWQYLTQTEVPLPQWPNYSTKLAATGALTTSLLLSPATVSLSQRLGTDSEGTPLPIVRFANQNLPQQQRLRKSASFPALSFPLSNILPDPPRPLTPSQEKRVTQAIFANWQITATAELDGQRLNTSFGTIGAEQHLRRFPGDNAQKHDAWPESGLAPRNGAWGLFAPSEEALTSDLRQKEKYYFAVQTWLSPGFSNNSLFLKDFFKFRKMIGINPRTGQAVIGVVGDAGPATWTGRQFGGSPEVMAALGFGQTRQGAVLLFFVNDPEGKIPLGPITSGNGQRHD